MKNAKFVAVLGLGLVAGGWGVARAQDAAPAAPAVAALPEDQQATKEQIAKLFDVMRLKQQIDTMLKMMPVMMQQQIKVQQEEALKKLPSGQKLTPEQQEQLDRFNHRMLEKAFNLYPAEEMIADITTVYQRHISRNDVEAMITFYNSAAGQHLLDAQPAITQEYLPLVMGHMKERSQAFSEEMAKEMQELLKPAAPEKN